MRRIPTLSYQPNNFSPGENVEKVRHRFFRRAESELDRIEAFIAVDNPLILCRVGHEIVRVTSISTPPSLNRIGFRLKS
jgi:hypothetical protein